MLALKSIKVAKFASEETHCFNAALYWDGKKVALVSNGGHGGPDSVDWLGAYDNKEHPTRKAIDAFISALPKVEFFGDEFTQTLETWCGEQVSDHLLASDVKRWTKARVMFISEGRLLESKRIPGERMAEAIDYFKNKYPAAIILNTLSIDDAVKATKGALA